MEKDIEILLEGIESRPLFKTRDDHERFCEQYREKVVPDLKKWERARALSLKEAQTRFVN